MNIILLLYLLGWITKEDCYSILKWSGLLSLGLMFLAFMSLK